MWLNCKRCWILVAMVSLRSNLTKSAKNQIVRLKSVLTGYSGRIFWYRPSLMHACARMTSFVLLCILTGESMFWRRKNENVGLSVSPLTRADKADIASMLVKPTASFRNGWGYLLTMDKKSRTPHVFLFFFMDLRLFSRISHKYLLFTLLLIDTLWKCLIHIMLKLSSAVSRSSVSVYQVSLWLAAPNIFRQN